jgi:hypothetical protein
MNRQETEARIAALRAERDATEAALAEARAAARQALIDGRPAPKTAAMAERVELLDGAIADLTDRLAGIEDREARGARVKLIERAQAAGMDRRALAAAVDAALAGLAAAWTAYREAVRQTVGSAVQAGADTVPLARVALNGGQSDALVKALIAATGGMDMVRALGVTTSNRPNHAVALTAAEDRVLRSLEAEVLRVRATSPQRHVAREAAERLEQMEREGTQA